MNELAKNLLVWLIVAVVLIAVFQNFNSPGDDSTLTGYFRRARHPARRMTLLPEPCRKRRFSRTSAASW